MASKPLLCRPGSHSYVQQHPADERSHGPDQEVCRRCGKHMGDLGGLPPGSLSGGGAMG